MHWHIEIYKKKVNEKNHALYNIPSLEGKMKTNLNIFIILCLLDSFIRLRDYCSD